MQQSRGAIEWIFLLAGFVQHAIIQVLKLFQMEESNAINVKEFGESHVGKNTTIPVFQILKEILQEKQEEQQNF